MAAPGVVNAFDSDVELDAKLDVNSDVDEERLQRASIRLQIKGYTQVPGGLPSWEVFDFIERLHACHHGRVVQMLESLRSRWLEGDEDSNRPGSMVAWLVTKRLEEDGVEGLWISATHPSVSEKTWDWTGPRFYVSVVEAAQAHFGEFLPRPPSSLARILWPCDNDQMQPHVTELGWTVVPAGSDPQQLHADISSKQFKIVKAPSGTTTWGFPFTISSCDPCPRSKGRFQHIIWKLDRAARCTTQVVPMAFTDGISSDQDYSRLHQLNAQCIMLDSEMLHRGFRTGADSWGTSCTVQFCSSSGWQPLQDRVGEDVMQYTCPIQPARHVADKSHPHVAHLEGFEVGTDVEAKSDGKGYPARVENRSEVICKGEEPAFTDGLSEVDLRHQRKGSANAVVEHECKVPGATEEKSLPLAKRSRKA